MKRVTPDPLNPSIQNSMTPFTSTLPVEVTLLILRKQASYTGIISVSLASKDLQVLVSTSWSNLFQLYFQKNPNTTEVKQEFLFEYNRCCDIYRSTLISFPPVNPFSQSFQICQNKLVILHYDHSTPTKIEAVDLTHIEHLNRTLLSTAQDGSFGLGVYQDKIVKCCKSKFELWNLTPWKQEASLGITLTMIGPLQSFFERFVLSHPSKFITLTDQTCIAEWDLSTQSPIWLLRYPPERLITRAAIGGERVVIGHVQGRISIIDLTEKKQILSIEAHTQPITSVIIHNQTIYSSSQSGDIKSWDLQTLAPKDSHQFPMMCHTLLYVWGEKLVAKRFDPRSEKSTVVLLSLNLKLTQRWQLLRHQTFPYYSKFASYQGKLIAQTKEGIQICDYTVPEYVLKPLKSKD